MGTRVFRRNAAIQFQLLERRAMLSASDPSGREQQTLELINRMRQNPAAELPLLLNSTDPNVQSGLSFFKVDRNVLAQQWATLIPAPPLAWNSILAGAALAHDQLMRSADVQQHQIGNEPDLGARVSAAGYSFHTVGESIFASSHTVLEAHGAFAIDWTNATPTGIQNPPGHRANIMNPDFHEVGIAVLDAAPGKKQGPLLFTEDFGARFNAGDPFLLGSVFNDANGDGFYAEGEGLAGVSVHVVGSGGTFDTTTLSAGGYQVQAPAGTYAVTYSGGGLAHPITLDHVVVAADNVQRDVVAQDVFAAVNNGVLVVAGTSGADTIRVSDVNGTLVADRNGVSESFPAAGVVGVLVQAGAGNDSVTIDSSVFINNTVLGGRGADTIVGGGGNEVLSGGRGPDSIRGGTSNDSIVGGKGRDTLVAGPGNDILVGGAGRNSLAGGAGSDVFFAINNQPDTIVGGSGQATVHADQGLDSVMGVNPVDILFS